jgi:hypothetical protein
MATYHQRPGVSPHQVQRLTLPGFSFNDCSFASCLLNSLHLQQNTWQRSRISDSNIVAGGWTGGALVDILIERSVLTSVTFQQTEINMVEFRNCEMNAVTFAVRNSNVRFENCRFVACSFEGWIGTGGRFINCAFNNVAWSVEALDGAEFDGGSFIVGSEELPKAMENRRHKWSEAPIFRQVSGLGAEVRAVLAKAGSKFPKRIRDRSPKRRMLKHSRIPRTQA